MKKAVMTDLVLGPGMYAEIVIYEHIGTKQIKRQVHLVYEGDGDDVLIHKSADKLEVYIGSTALDDKWHEKLAELILRDAASS